MHQRPQPVYALCDRLTSQKFHAPPLLPHNIVRQKDPVTPPSLTPASLSSQVQGFDSTLPVCVQ